jgi:predicted ATP-binding protein involved in virulence
MNNDENNKHSKLIHKSKSGDFSSSYQLYRIFIDGVGVEPDEATAEMYKNLFVDQLSGYEFRVDSIKLINYKGFEDLSLSFNKHGTTVLVGNNGSGKSTVLDAIQKTLSHLSSRLTTRSYNGDQIDELEIKSKSDFATIATVFSIQNLSVHVEVSQSRPLSQVPKKSKFTELNELGNIFRVANTVNRQFSLPLIASYNVERANDVTTKDIEKSEEILDSYLWSKSRGYSKSLTGKADFRLFFKWFKEATEVDNENNTEFVRIKSLIEEKESQLNSPLLKSIFSDISDNNSKALAVIESYKNEIEHLKIKLDNCWSNDSRMLEVVKNAIYTFLPGFSELKIQRNPLDLHIKKNDEYLSVLQLSQGEKSLLALVGDIARRLTLLNPDLENPLSGPGVVLIDEIDLHMHPSWQQVIITRLQATFNNIQFIVTTHSPQVCHTVSSDNIWLLKNGRKYKAPKGIQGAVSSWVLKNLFDVEERPPEDEYVVKLIEYTDLVYSDLYNTTRAIELDSILRGHFGNDCTDLVELRLYIENREWEKNYDSDK